MSILKHLKKISAGQSTQLYARHPLRADAHETRLRYLGLDGDEAAEQPDERATVQEDDIRRLLGLIRERNLRCLFLLEVDRRRLPAVQALLAALGRALLLCRNPLEPARTGEAP